MNDTFAHVRAEAVRTITQCLASVKTVPLNDANTFPEYILPQLVGNMLFEIVRKNIFLQILYKAIFFRILVLWKIYKIFTHSSSF